MGVVMTDITKLLALAKATHPTAPAAQAGTGKPLERPLAHKTLAQLERLAYLWPERMDAVERELIARAEGRQP